MRKATLLCALLAVGRAKTLKEDCCDRLYRQLENPNELWKDYQRRYVGRASEQIDEGEKRKSAEDRQDCFDKTMATAKRLCEEARSKGADTCHGLNSLSDLCPEEFDIRAGVPGKPGARVPGKARRAEQASKAGARRPLPTGLRRRAQPMASSVDWRSKGAVTQVKDQGQCGSCWSFSSTGGIEGAWAVAGNKLTSVSEQELVSCDKIDEGCNGGLMDNAYEWLMSSKGGQIVTEAAYPYTSGGGSSGTSGNCKLPSGDAGVLPTIKIDGYADLPQSESAMADYVAASGPLPIAV